MQVKQHCIPFFLLTLAFLCFIFPAPAFAELKDVEEEELARTNVSISGTPVATVDGVAVSTDDESLIKTADTRIDKTESDLTASMLIPRTATTGAFHTQSLNNQEVSKTFVGGAYGTYTGGITTVTPR